MPQNVRVKTDIERHTPELPRYAVIPADAIAVWKLGKETTVVDLSLNGVPVERRTIKYWDDQRWFLSITAKDCRLLDVDTGDSIDIEMSLASTDLPKELQKMLDSNRAAEIAWGKLTSNQQRMLREEIAAAKRPATRKNRARRVLLGE